MVHGDANRHRLPRRNMVGVAKKGAKIEKGSGQMASHVFKNFFDKPEMWDGLIEMTTDKRKATEFFKLTMKGRDTYGAGEKPRSPGKGKGKGKKASKKDDK